MEQVIEGTWDEIKLHETELTGHRLMVVIDPPEPPNTVRDLAHLEELLEGGFRGQPHIVTDESWEERTREFFRRREAQNKP